MIPNPEDRYLIHIQDIWIQEKIDPVKKLESSIMAPDVNWNKNKIMKNPVRNS